MSKMDNWFRKHDPRKQADRDHANRDRLAKADSIMQRQKDGTITGEQASLEFDELLMADCPDGRLIYYSDSTGLTADFDKDVMLFPKIGATMEHREPSNTGIYARGPKRGFLITHPAGATPDCDPGCLEHFTKGSKGWIGHEHNIN